MSSKVRVRYAPSPTGELHIGNARTALFNYLFARHHGGDFIIRTEDTDLIRNIEQGESSQLDNLTWLNIEWDEAVDKPNPQYAPYRQSERLHIYEPLIQQLLDEDKAYRCYMTSEELDAEAQAQREAGETPRYGGAHAHLTPEQEQAFIDEGRDYSIRFRVNSEAVYAFDDIVKGDISFKANDVAGDFVILKRDGMPTYNFAVTVDDHYMDITHVLRGDDHIANTPRQMMIYEAFGWEPPRFGHMTLIINEEGRKLSKRDGGIIQFIEQYRDLGYLPEALFNFVALLGWSPEGEEELFTQEELIKIFDENRLSNSPAAFDRDKLLWIGNEYMKKADLQRVVDLAFPHLIKAGLVEDNPSLETIEWATRLVGVYQEQMAYGAQIVELASLFFNEDLKLDQASIDELSSETGLVVVKAIKEKLTQLPEEEFVAENVRPLMNEIRDEHDIRGRQLFMPIRIAVSGVMSGPEVPDLIELLGKEKVLDHIHQVEQQIS